ELAGKGVERRHDVGDRAIAVLGGVRSRRSLRLLPDAWIGLLDHLLAEIHADQIVLEDVVIEHVFGGFAQIDDPFGERRRLHAIGHVLRVDRAGRMIIAADAADAARDKMRVARILAFHEDAVATEDRRSAVAFGNAAIVEVDLGEDAETADDAGDRIPVHLHEIGLRSSGPRGFYYLIHDHSPKADKSPAVCRDCSQLCAAPGCGAISALY